MLGAKINFEKIEKLQILGALLKCETVKTLNFYRKHLKLLGDDRGPRGMCEKVILDNFS